MEIKLNGLYRMAWSLGTLKQDEIVRVFSIHKNRYFVGSEAKHTGFVDALDLREVA